jgi:hypothetical protein
MLSSHLHKYIIFGSFFIASSSFASFGQGQNNGEFHYNIIDDGIQLTSCVDECPYDLVIPNIVDGYTVNTLGGVGFQNRQLTSLIIPDSVTSIESGTFMDNQLTTLTLPNSVKSIGDNAFRNNQLSSLTIPSSVTYIGGRAFKNNLLTNINIPDSVTFIDSSAFSYNQLTSINFSENITVISAGILSYNQLASVTIPASVTSIQNGAFSNNQLTKIIFHGDRPDVHFNAFSMNSPDMITYCSGTAGWPGEPIKFVTPQLDESCNISDTENESFTYATFDIDQSGSVDALSDGLILLRYFFNLRGDSLISGVISPDANRTSAADIEAYIESHMP